MTALYPSELILDQYKRYDVRGTFAGPPSVSRRFRELEHIASWWQLPHFRAGRKRAGPTILRERHTSLVHTVRVRITSQADDAEENMATGGVYTTSTDLEFGAEGLGS